MRAIPLPCRRDQPQALIMPQCLLMYLSPLCGYTDDIPGAISSIRHTPSLLSRLYLCFSPIHLRMNFDTTTAGQFLKQYAFLTGKIHREKHLDASIKITAALGP